MGTADTTTQESEYDAAYVALQQDDKAKITLKAWLECVLLFLAICGYCGLQGYLNARDLSTQNTELQTQLVAAQKVTQRICQIKQANIVHEFNCQVLNQQYASADYGNWYEHRHWYFKST